MKAKTPRLLPRSVTGKDVNMDRNFVLLTDSSADLPSEVLKEYGIGCIELSLCIDGETKRGSEVEPKAFYDLLRSKATITTIVNTNK